MTLEDRVAEAGRMLVGEAGRAADPVAAAQLYREAMADGSGAAAERLAVLAAMGVAREPDWREAVSLLVSSAQLGWTPAQGQLAVLANTDNLSGETSWEAVARSIDLDAWLTPPAVKPFRNKPAIMLFEGMATPLMCRWLIARGGGRLKRGMVGDLESGRWVPDPIRTGLAAGFGLADTDVIFVLTQERLARASSLMVHQQEAPHVLSYLPGQEYKAHFDFLNPALPAFERQLAIMGQRVATCLTWLNDDYTGGETEFPKIGWRHKGRAGDAMLFLNVTPNREPDPLTLHAGRPVTQGRKWLLSQWVRDRVQAIV